MKNLSEQMTLYASYHQDSRNRFCHFIGIPIVTFSLAIALSWVEIFHSPFRLSLAPIVYCALLAYFMRLDPRVAIMQLPFSAIPFVLGHAVTAWPLKYSLSAFGAATVIGWTFQLVGHYLEGRRPALVDNLGQILNAPLFLACEVAAKLGWLQGVLEPRKADLVTHNK